MFRFQQFLFASVIAIAVFSCGDKSEQSAPPGTQTVETVDHSAAKQKFKTVCTACHGANAEGMKALNAPALAGQEAWYIETQLKNYRSGVRGTDPNHIPGTQMAPMAAALTEEEIPALAAYLHSLPAKASEPTVEGSAETGKQQYSMVCAACHGSDAKGNESLKAPSLLINNDWYLLEQLIQFKHGTRGQAEGDVAGLQMRQMAMTVQDEQAMKDIVAYINSLQKAGN